MYKNRIDHKTSKLDPKFFIRRSEIAFDDRLAFIEHVCGVLVESRFGPGRVEPVVIDMSNRPELEPAVFYDLCNNGEMVPCYSVSPHGRAGFQVVEAAFRSAKQKALVGAEANAFNSAAALSPNQGRGSP